VHLRASVEGAAPSPTVYAVAHVQHHTQDAANAEPWVPEGGVGGAQFTLKNVITRRVYPVSPESDR
jgi:hypothetical protein